MEIEEKNGVTHYSDFEIHKALTNFERGISLEAFFLHEAKRFKFGEDEYFKMLIREVKIESQMYRDEDWEYYHIAFGVGLKEVEKIILDLQKTNAQPPANQAQTDLKIEQRLNVIDIPKIYTHNPKNENYMHDYLGEIKASFDFRKKLTFGAVCLALYTKKRFKPYLHFNKLVELLAEYWNIEPPRDKRPNKYKNKMDELINKYAILEREIK